MKWACSLARDGTRFVTEGSRVQIPPDSLTNTTGGKSMAMAYLVGYVKENEDLVKLKISVEELRKVPTYEVSDGDKYVELNVKKDRLRLLLDGEIDVTSITAIY